MPHFALDFPEPIEDDDDDDADEEGSPARAA